MSRGARNWPLALAVGLLLLYGTRAATGWIGGTAYGAGRRLAEAHQYEKALPLLARGAVGQDRAASRWLAGLLYLNLFQAHQRREGVGADELAPWLAGAYRAQTEAISLSPASGWYWASLADVYHQVERRGRYLDGRPLEVLDRQPWTIVGRPGRTAIGMLRIAIDREPTQYVFRDQLAFVLLVYGLRDEALEAVRESARAQPEFSMHLYTNLRPIPPDVLDAFAESSRDALGELPLMRRGLHLLALAKLELRRGRPEQAERDLREMFDAPGTELNRADASFQLGLALEAQGRHREAEEAFVRSELQPVFAAPALAHRARIAETLGDLDRSLSLLRRARRLAPRDVGYALSYARVARRIDKPSWAEEALRWAAQTHRDDPRPLRELETLLREKGDAVEAEEVKRALERLEERLRKAPP